jgi:RyR domain
VIKIEDIAMVCHNVNKAYCLSIGDATQTEWELAPDWQRQSAINGVKAHLYSDLTMRPEDSHVSWMKQKESEGWVYGEVKDADKKTHPCMVPYDQLPVSQRTKDYLFREVVHCLSSYMGE